MLDQFLISALIIVLGFAALLTMDLVAHGVRSLMRQVAAWRIQPPLDRRTCPLQATPPLIDQKHTEARLGS